MNRPTAHTTTRETGPPASETYRQTVQRLSSAQKSAARGAPAYSIYVNRRVGRYLAAGAYRLGLTPNMVTAVSAVFTFAGIALLAVGQPSWVLGISVWLLLALGYAFDSADGQVARLRGGGSASGEWLDHVVDSVKISTLHLAVLVTAFTHFSLSSPVWLLVPIGFTVVAAVSFFAMILNDLLKAKHGSGAAPTGHSTVWRALLGAPTDYGLLCFAFVLLGAPWLFFLVYALLFVANLGYLVLALIKWFRDMNALGSVPARSAAEDS
ncbi:CDP-alcohol phosphatidyltransferase family protein [Cryobacterium psychrophilum]|uniref:CDP-alcohol phosphatidyltransferase n=1 Tax=Cryobacterium psychrophilum TaxID=41988 RepID=A0A4Y8KL50_9MICO|nr:CDP-alcohol phosphatidyltransferase family protein [Cryobacterium psychrophilum]TDW29953.1 CDP-alcohol phosphatidyltransferase-like enzyme [Cryobacterium psychrophilum]TFD76516.1 CDP-alcohol phosphatidyltransferase [Cryobacterium psychrophilum]